MNLRRSLLLLVVMIVTTALGVSYWVSREIVMSMVGKAEAEKAGNIGTIVKSLVDEYAEGVQIASRVLSTSERLGKALEKPGTAQSRKEFATLLGPMLSEDHLDILEITDDREIVRYRSQESGRTGDRSDAWGVSEALRGKRTLVAHNTPSGTSVLAINPLYHGTRIVGTVIAGRLLDERFIKDLGRKVNADLALLSPRKVLAASSKEVMGTLDKGAIEDAFHQKIPVFRTASEGYAKIVYLPLLIVDEGFVMMVRIDSGAAIEALQESFSKVAKWMAVFLLICIGVVYILLDLVLKPLRSLRDRAEQTAVSTTGESIPAPASDEIGSVVHVLDTLTERLLAQNRALTQSRAEAESANEAKSLFLSNMSHEIRTPLNGVLGMAELLEGTSLSPDQRKYCQAIASSGHALYDLLSDILDLSKIEAGKIEVEAIDFSLAVFLEETTSVFSGLADTRGNKFIAEVNIPSPGSFRGDPTRLRQVLSNLLGNAVKFTERGVITLAVSPLAPRADDPRTWLRFGINDTGIGISPENQKSLFKPFSQGDPSTTRRYGGTGLGLVISKQLVSIMGGSLEIDSAPGVGTRIRFDLPFATAESAVETRATVARGSNRLAARVLLAEDNPVNQEVVCAMLALSGAEVVPVENGQLAVEALRQGDFDMVLMDCRMPVMDGYEATRIIRREEAPGRRIPIIALTANAFSEDREQCLAAGMDDYLNKPVKLRILSQTLTKWACGSGHAG